MSLDYKLCDCEWCKNKKPLLPSAEPTRAIYYEVCYRSALFPDKLGSLNDAIYAERRHAEMRIELEKVRNTSGQYFIGTLSVPVSEVER